MQTASAAQFNSTTIGNTSNQVVKKVEANKTLPTTVKIGDKTITPYQLLYLQVKSLTNLNKPVTLKTVYKAPTPQESLKPGYISKTEYLKIAKHITWFIETKGRLPNYAQTSLGTMRTENYIYMFSRLSAHYSKYKKLPDKTYVKKWVTPSLIGTAGTTESAILRKAAKYGYSRGISTAEGLIKYGCGDCWAMSDYLYKQFKAAKIKVRIVQYATAYASNHRSVQLYKFNSWVDVLYRSYGFNMLFNNTSGSKYGSVIAKYLGS